MKLATIYIKHHISIRRRKLKEISATVGHRYNYLGTSHGKLNSVTFSPLAPNDIYIYRAVSPLNGRMAIKLVGGGDLIPAPKGS